MLVAVIPVCVKNGLWLVAAIIILIISGVLYLSNFLPLISEEGDKEKDKSIITKVKKKESN